MDTDLTLLDRYHGEGDVAAFRSLVQLHAGMVFATARRVTGNAALAEEVVQDTFLALLQQGTDLEEFKEQQRESMIIPVMKQRVTKDIADPAEKQRAIDDWLSELRFKAALNPK